MIITKVLYTVKPEYASRNHENISNVMADLRSKDSAGFRYNVFLDSDQKTFIHLFICEDEESEKALLDLPLFKQFQQELRASQPEVSPVVSKLSLVGSSKDWHL